MTTAETASSETRQQPAPDHKRCASWESDQPGGHIDQAIQLANSGK